MLSIAPPLTARKYLLSVFGILPECLHENKGTCRYMFIISHFFYKRYSAIHFLLLIFLFNFLETSLRMISGHSFLYLPCWLLPHGTHCGLDSLLLVDHCFSPMLQWLFSAMNHSTCLLRNLIWCLHQPYMIRQQNHHLQFKLDAFCVYMATKHPAC